MLAFVSYDLGNDEPALGKFIEGSSGSTAALQVDHWSLKPPAAGPEWQKVRRDRISRSDLMIVLVGAETATADNVLEEIHLAKLSNVPFFGIYLEPVVPDTPLPPGLPVNRTMPWDWLKIPAALNQLMKEGKHHKFR
jgi:hypothetical protein